MSDAPLNLADLKREPVAELVTTCEKLLAMAKSGELRGLVYGTIRPGHWIGTGWEVSDGYMHDAIAGASLLQNRIVSTHRDAAEVGDLDGPA